jgi:hypothetical protein
MASLGLDQNSHRISETAVCRDHTGSMTKALDRFSLATCISEHHTVGLWRETHVLPVQQVKRRR